MLRQRISAIIVFCSLFVPPLSAQYLSSKDAEQFIYSLVHERHNIAGFYLEDELSASRRLGISYEGVRYKFLIGDDLSPAIKDEIRNRTVKYALRVDSLHDGYSEVIFSVPERNIQQSFFFKDGKAISRITYYTRRWHTWESNHFRFLLSDTVLFNRYSAARLERFLDSAAAVLNFSQRDMEHLKKEKIVYVLCKDEEEIEQLTKFKTLGMYILAYDYVVTTFNCHYHEILHLLINYKLRNLPGYTHPFFQEGFAVAFGGRGGKEPGVILDAGYFLLKSRMLEYPLLLRRNEFLQQDASISYPVAGLYNLFLLRESNIEDYLRLYRKYSFSDEGISGAVIDSADLPPPERWEKFLDAYVQHKAISLKRSPHPRESISDIDGNRIFETTDGYILRMKDTMLLSARSSERKYESKRFAELFPDRTYHGEKYAVIVTPQEITIHNLYTNNMIANLVGSLCIPPVTISDNDGVYEFEVEKNIFDERLKELSVNAGR